MANDGDDTAVRFLARTTRKMRRLVLFGGIVTCSSLLLRTVHFRRSERGEGGAELGGGDGPGAGAGGGPRDRPGYFMRGRLPSGDASRCDFRYGLPTSLDWSLVRVAGTPQLGRDSPYGVVYDAVERTARGGPPVTYATHATPEFLYHVVEIARRWDGPVSVAAFVPDRDVETVARLFAQLCSCDEGMAKVSLHLVFPLADRPRFPRGAAAPAGNASRDCSEPDAGRAETYRSRYGLVYPVNVARNVARNASTTAYSLVSDVEMIPSEGLASRFALMMRRRRVRPGAGRRLAFVVPVFEVEAGEDVPRDKPSLQRLYAEGKAVYFHRWVCAHCQRIPDLQAWIKEDPGKVIKPFAVTKRQFPYHRWEPIYIAAGGAPWYGETLSWEGRQDKMTQMLEMCLESYDFVIVDGAFLCHSPGIKAKPKRRSWRRRHETANAKQYELIARGLAERYPANPKCRLR